MTERRGRSRNRSSPHSERKDTSQKRSKSRKGIECYHCGKPGHIKRECRILKRENLKEKGEESNKKEDVTAALVYDGDVAILADDTSINLTCQDFIWVIDSAASFHVMYMRDSFISYTAGDYGSVRMGNEVVAKIVGIGDVCLETDIGCRLMLKNVRHVPDMRLQLISTGILDDEDYVSTFSSGK